MVVWSMFTLTWWIDGSVVYVYLDMVDRWQCCVFTLTWWIDGSVVCGSVVCSAGGASSCFI